MAKKKKIQSAFVTFTEEQVAHAESVLFVVQVGTDFYKSNQSYTFHKRAAIVNYNKVFKELLDMIDGGNKKERQQANMMLQNLHIHPLKLH